MDLDIKYGEIRSEVIAKLLEQRDEMKTGLEKLEETVNEIPTYMEGAATSAYMNEFETIVKSIYTALNVNIGEFAEQLECVCKKFEQTDTDIQNMLNN